MGLSPRRNRRRRLSRRAVSPVIATLLLIAITITAGALLWMISLKPAPPPPTVYYTAQGGTTYPVWGDATDCTPVLPQPISYYTNGGTSNPNWPTYSSAWTTQCKNGATGNYNQMTASVITITKVSQSIPLSAVQFRFTCYNATPVVHATTFLSGSLKSISWFPGTSVSIPSTAPHLNSCATFNASKLGESGTTAFFNRLAFYQPLSPTANLIESGDAIILYLHVTPRSILEAPNPLDPSSSWFQPDTDDFHGAPAWCFTSPGACTLDLLDTQAGVQMVLASIPVASLA